MQFVDEAVIDVAAGSGGNGCLSFHRARNLPRGGPDGGNGGNGGDVELVGDAALNTLVDFRFMPRYSAPNGKAGGGRDKTGASGDSLHVRVPVGTTVMDEETQSTIGDVAHKGETLLVARGGRRGYGNAHFKSSTNRAPRRTTDGAPGEQRRLRLTLRVIADAGLLGLPNAGKSTLISRVSASKPKVADYPFTTLTPNLGVVRVGEDASFVMADVPGLVPGASSGAGLGSRFLRHLSRVRLLLHLVDAAPADGSDPVANARRIEAELFAYSEALREREIWLVATKLDLPNAQAAFEALREAFPARVCCGISALRGDGVEALTARAMAHVAQFGARIAADPAFAEQQRSLEARIGEDIRKRAFDQPAKSATNETAQ